MSASDNIGGMVDHMPPSFDDKFAPMDNKKMHRNI